VLTHAQAVRAAESSCSRSKASGVLEVSMPKASPQPPPRGGAERVPTRRPPELLASLMLPTSRIAHSAAFEDTGEPPDIVS